MTIDTLILWKKSEIDGNFEITLTKVNNTFSQQTIMFSRSFYPFKYVQFHRRGFWFFRFSIFRPP